jgi:hypothetical protein
MATSFPVRVQAIRSRGQNPRLYINFPLALAAAIGLEPGEEVQWELLDRHELHLVRTQPVLPTAKTRAKKQAATPS